MSETTYNVTIALRGEPQDALMITCSQERAEGISRFFHDAGDDDILTCTCSNKGAYWEVARSDMRYVIAFPVEAE